MGGRREPRSREPQLPSARQLYLGVNEMPGDTQTDARLRNIYPVNKGNCMRQSTSAQAQHLQDVALTIVPNNERSTLMLHKWTVVKTANRLTYWQQARLQHRKAPACTVSRPELRRFWKTDIAIDEIVHKRQEYEHHPCTEWRALV